MKSICFMLLSVCVICSCASSGGISENYFAKHKSTLLEKRGQPNSTEPDGKGGEVWTYLVKQKILIEAESLQNANDSEQLDPSFYMPQAYSTTVAQKFYISNQGYIYKVQ